MAAKIVLSIAMMACLIGGIAGQCYHCNSRDVDDAACSDLPEVFDATRDGVSTASSPECANDRCVKYEYEGILGDMVFRDCDNAGVCDALADSDYTGEVEATIYGITAEVYCCQGSLCNSAGIAEMSFLLSALALVFAVLCR